VSTKENHVLVKNPAVLKSEKILVSCKAAIRIAPSAGKGSILAAVKGGIVEIATGNHPTGAHVFSVLPNTLLALGSDKEYTLKATEETGFELQCLHLSGIQYRRCPEGVFPYAASNPVIELGADAPPALGAFDLIFQELELQRKEWLPLSGKLCECLFLYIHRAVNDERNLDTAEAIATQICKYIDAHYNHNISLEDLSEIVYVSPYHLSHIFKMRMGISPIQYLISVRIEKAKAMLKGTNMSIAEISCAIGYPHANYFNEIFKRATGVTPGRFRKSASEPMPLSTGYFTMKDGNTGGETKPQETGLRIIGGKTYFLDENGQMAIGWRDTKQGRMYFTMDGTAATGLTNADGAWYCFDENHCFLTGLQAIGADPQTGEGGDIYFFKSDGKAKIGWWRFDDGNWMYFGNDGRAATGWVYWKNNWYYLGADHLMVRGLVEVNGNQYYLDPGVGDGAMLTGAIAVGDKEDIKRVLIRQPQEC
jgi:AraC-like DNA-binding protein